MSNRAVLNPLWGLSLALGLSACASSSMPAPIVRPGVTPRPARPPIAAPTTPTTPATPIPPPIDFVLTPARFTDIPGWAQADFVPALIAFRRQCDGWRNRTPDAPLSGGRYGGQVGAWLPACDAATTIQPGQEHCGIL